MKSNLKFNYSDYGFMRNSKFEIIRLDQCYICGDRKGRGFKIGHQEDIQPVDFSSILEQFVCLECIPDLLNENGYHIKDSKDIVFIDIGIGQRYSQLKMRYEEGKIRIENFLEHREEFAKYIQPMVMEAIDYLVDLDNGYKENVFEGPKWQGWWLGASGKDLGLFFNWLRAVTKNDKYTNLIRDYKTSRRTEKIPLAVRCVDTIMKEFGDTIKKNKMQR